LAEITGHFDDRRWFSDARAAMAADLDLLIRAESVESEGAEGAPFGGGVRDALDAAMRLFQREGFSIIATEGLFGAADWGAGKETVAALCHCDVVPPGNGWTVAPFKLTVKEGKWFGRGVVDDKGPLIMLLYAVKYLKESGFVPSRRLRVIVGTNEETGWKGIARYKELHEEPDFAFAPDAVFPVINAEKGILHLKIRTAVGIKGLVSLTGGDAPNMVAGHAEAVFDSRPLCAEDKDIISRSEGGMWMIGARGKTAHASLPETGENAIDKLFDVLGRYYSSPAAGMLKALNGEWKKDFHDDISGELTVNTGMAGDDGFSVDIRYPVTRSSEEVLKALAKALGSGAEITVEDDTAPHSVDGENRFVKALGEAYGEVTGKGFRPPESMGGGTYGRAFKNGVAFGPLFPDDEETAHQADEYLKESSFVNGCVVYASALRKLLS